MKRCSFNEYILLSFLADQIVLSGTSKDDFSALSGLEMTGLKNIFFVCVTSQKKKKKGIAPGSYMENLFKHFCVVTDYFVFFIWSFTILSLCKKNIFASEIVFH